MKKALKLVCIILVLTYGVDKLVYVVLNSISDKVLTGQSIGKLNQFLSQKDTLDLIAFGTSRSNHHIDVKQLTHSSYNMGMDGSAIAYAATLIETLPKSKPQVVLLNIDPNKVFVADYTASDLKGLNTKYNRNPIIGAAIKKAHQDNPLQPVLWSLDYNSKAIGIIKNYFLPKYDPKTYYGFDPLEVTESQTEQFLKSLDINIPYDCNDNKKINPLVWDYLLNIKDFCQKNNKTLMLLTTPTYQSECELEYRKLKNALDSIDVFYKDYSSFFKNQNKGSYWKDKTHMSASGAAIFTEALKLDLEHNHIINP